MRRNKLVSLIVGTSLAFSGLFAESVNAQNAGNLSNITGSNLSNITGTNVFDGATIFIKTGGLNSLIIQKGEKLADELTDAYVACDNCECDRTPQPCELRGFLLGESSNKPRTVGLVKKAPTQTCSSSPSTSANSNCRKLNILLRESKTFLNEVNQKVEVTKANIANRAW